MTIGHLQLILKVFNNYFEIWIELYDTNNEILTSLV